MLLKCINFILKYTVPLSEKLSLLKFEKFSIIPVFFVSLLTWIFLIVILSVLDNYIPFISIIKTLLFGSGVFIMGILFTASFLIIDENNSMHLRIILIIHKLLKNPIYKKELIKEYQENSCFENLFKSDVINGKIEKKDGEDLYIKTKNEKTFWVSEKKYEKYKDACYLLKQEGINLTENSYSLMNDLEILKEIKKQKKEILIKEREVRARIFMNKDSIEIFEEEYGKELMKKDDSYLNENKERQEYSIFNIENE